MDGMNIEISGERVHLLPCRAAFWEQARTLIVADLHLGKCETMRSAGLPIPLGVIERDLSRLAAAILETGAQRLLIVGDLLHHGLGLTPQIIASVADWREREADDVEIAVVPGNHDRALGAVAPTWRMRVLDEVVREGPFAFVHDPAAAVSSGDCAVIWSGHVHPMVRLVGRGDSIGLPCFVVGERAVVLPAFSEFTGGVYVAPQPGQRLLAIADRQVIDAGVFTRPRAAERRPLRA
ncbi:MAG: ligase-associated DNA damage response endonuclease PdeM [Phycisphaeraceae bacterium]|nr:ligase-associated DNA damage response endonuclease PdeM [Phycisphaeraceae bacterium]MBX3407464.1 ligase-associated DNA damage response endonuclease PdeM [Phycisphaeraceae bacterium]